MGVLGLRNPGLEGLGDGLADGLELDPVENVGEEAAHDQALGLAPGDPARHRVEELVAVDGADRGAVGAANVVGLDLEAGDRVGVRLLGEDQVAVLLVGVRLLRVLLDLDHPAPDRRRMVAEGALEGEVGGRVRGDVLLEGVVVEVLIAVGEVGPGNARGRARAREVVLDPRLALLGAEAAGDPIELGVAIDPRAVGGEVPGLGGEVLQRDVLDLRALAYEELGDGVRVTREIRPSGRVLLDNAKAALRLSDDEETPEQRAAVPSVRNSNVERLFEDESLRNLDEQAVLPERRVVGGELLVGADERAEQLVVAQRLEGDALRRALDLDSVFADRGHGGHVEVEHRRRGARLGTRSRDMAVGDKGVRVEALQVGEAPRLVRRRRERQRPIALEQLGPAHGAYLRCRISEFPSGSSKKAMLQMPESRSPTNSTPFASSSARAPATSATRRAIPWLAPVTNSTSWSSGFQSASVTFPASNSVGSRGFCGSSSTSR